MHQENKRLMKILQIEMVGKPLGQLSKEMLARGGIKEGICQGHGTAE